MNLRSPHFVALDTSQFANWIRDKASGEAFRESAQEFERTLADRGLIIVLTTHHLFELMAIETPGLAATRLRALASLPLIASPAPFAQGMVLGDMIDLVVAEATAASHASRMTVAEVRAQVRPSALRLMSGEEAIAPYVCYADELHKIAKASADRQREKVAVTELAPEPVSKMKIQDLLNGQFRKRDDTARIFNGMHSYLQRQIAAHGDGRLTKPDEISRRFHTEVLDMANALPFTSVRDFVVASLARLNVGVSDLTPDMTFDDAAELGVFRTQLRIAVSRTNRPWSEFMNVKREQLPSWSIRSALNKHAHRRNKRLGSIQNDRYLACLAPYATTTFVDRQTKEDARRAIHKEPAIRPLMQSLARSVPYTRVPEAIAA